VGGLEVGQQPNLSSTLLWVQVLCFGPDEQRGGSVSTGDVYDREATELSAIKLLTPCSGSRKEMPEHPP